jgi:ribulose 1,5-bisphosphate synthetase/thiazole synthase
MSSSASRTIREQARDLPIWAEADVLVAGLGPAGLGAAVAAARLGARVIGLERHGCAGGMMTAGGVLNIREYTDKVRPVVAGVAAELADRLAAAGGTPHNPREGTRVMHDPEITKFVAQKMLLESGADVWLHTWIAGALVEDGRLTGLVVENKSGRGAVLGRVTVDATGDGDVIGRSGAEHVKADVLQPMTLAFTIGGGKPWPNGLDQATRDRIQAELKAGTFPSPKGLAFFAMPRRGEYYVNGTRVAGDCTRGRDLTKAELEGRRQVMGIMAWLRKNAPGFEDAFLLTTPPQVGLRESRRLAGLYELTREDVLECREFPDAIARSHYGIDIHYPGAGGEMTHLPDGRSYGIPYRCLVPKRLDGLLASGRCLSATRDALGSARVMAICMATGQAAGVAAALAARADVSPRRVNPDELRQTLVKQGVIL